MLKITVIAFGTLSESYFREAADTYKKRLGAAFTEIELKETKLPREPSATDIAKALEDEADRMLAAIPKRARVVAMCVEGKEYSSPELSAMLESAAAGGTAEVCFLIGSSYGLSPRVKAAADVRLSLSRLTMPHQLARVVLLEAIYRAEEIRRGTKYHK